MSAEPSAKRRRAGQLGLLSPAPTPPAAFLPSPASTVLLEADSGDEAGIERPDLFQFMAERHNRHRGLEAEVERLQQREAELAAQLQAAELEAAKLRADSTGASARQEAREAQLELQLQEQQEALHLEVQLSAGLSQQLRAANAAAEAAERRATAALAEAAAAAAQGLGAGAQQGGPASAELQLRVTQLQRELEASRADAEEERRRSDAALRTAEERRQAEAATARLLQQQLEEAISLGERAAADKRAAEAAAAAAERRAVRAEAAADAARSSGGDAVLVRSLREQLREQEALVAEARRLREQATNLHVLREQLERAEARARAAEGLLPEAGELQGRAEAAEQQVARWRAILQGAADCESPEDVLHLLNALQQRAAEAAMAAGDRAEELAAARSATAAAENARQEAATAAAAAAARADECAVALSRAERKLALLAREREGLKAILASYDEEYLSQHGSELGPQQARIVELEAQVGALHAHARSLEEELAARGAAATGAHASAGEAAARAEAAEARVRALEAEAANLGRQVALLQERVGRGEFNAATTRVLHFKYNPEAEMAREARDARLAQLQSENEALRQHLQRLEEAAAAEQQQVQGAAAAAPSPAPSGGGMRLAQLEGEASLLRRKVAELTKGQERLQQVFNKQITIFREAVLALFGYRVEMATDPAARDFKAQFVLRPRHADDASQQLVFRMLRDSRVVLVPTDFSARMQREVDTFIDRFRSIPAFTANLTMEYFQKQTQC